MAGKLFGKIRRLAIPAAVLTLALVVACGSAAQEPAAPAGQPAAPAESAAAQEPAAAPAAAAAAPGQPAAPAQQEQSGGGTGSGAGAQPAAPTAAPAGPQTTRQEYVVPTPAPQAQPEPEVAAVTVANRMDKVAIAVGGQSWDSNYTYKVNIGGFLDKWPVYEYLVGIDNETGAYVPELATSWEMAPNGKDWTFNLREGVPWQDGYGEFSAEDVRHSLWLLVQPTAKPSGVSTWRKIMGVKKDDDEATVAQRAAEVVEIVDDNQVVIHLGIVLPEALFNLGKRRNLPMESKARWDAVGDEGMGEKMVGTGPLSYGERVEGSHVLYDAAEEHWRVVPQYDQLEYRAIAESQTRLAALLTEQVHLAVIERSIREEVNARGMEFVSGVYPGVSHFWHFWGNYHTEPDTIDPDNPLLKREVRQAMAKAVNREAIAEALLPGAEVSIPAYTSFTALDEQVWPGLINPEWAERWDEVYGYDPAAARELLAEAGYPDGFEFVLALDSDTTLPEIVDIGQAMALDFEAIGLRPQLQNIEASKIRSQRRAREIHNTISGSAGYNYTVYHLETRYCTCGSVHAFQDQFIDGKIEELNVTIDKGQRTALMREIGDFCYEQICTLPMFDIAPDIAVNPKFIKSYVFPGFISGFYTHLEYIETIPQ